MKSKMALVVSVVLLIVLASVTFAYWTWSGINTNVSFTVNGLDVTFDGGNNLTGKNLIPMASKPTSESSTTGIYKQFTASATQDLYMSVLLTLKTFPTNLKHQSLVWQLDECSTSCTTASNFTKVNNGNLGSAAQGGVITLVSNRLINSTTKTYRLYIWIDGTQANPNTMMNQGYEFLLSATATDQKPSQ